MAIEDLETRKLVTDRSADETVLIERTPEQATEPAETLDSVRAPAIDSTTSVDERGVSVSVGSQSRFDPLTGRWVVFAPDRLKRPNDFSDHRDVFSKSTGCPFCGGHEAATPPALLVVPEPLSDDTGDGAADAALTQAVADSQSLYASEGDANPARSMCAESIRDVDGLRDWSVRVVPNKFPAVSRLDRSDSGPRKSKSFPKSSVLKSVSVDGGHEVIVESPRHIESLSELDEEHAGHVFLAFKQRLLAWRSRPSVRYISVFKNVGRHAGASLHHAHSQLIALDRLPADVEQTLWRKSAHHAKHGSCLQCDLLRQELKAGQRIIVKKDDLVAFCPFASAFAMSVRITTLRHSDCFENLDDVVIRRIAKMTRRVTAWLEKMRPGVAYNYVLQTRPPNWKGSEDSFHWTLDVIPRISHIAGFELSCGTMLNSVLPEKAAASYRQVASRESLRSF